MVFDADYPHPKIYPGHPTRVFLETNDWMAYRGYGYTKKLDNLYMRLKLLIFLLIIFV